MRLLLVIFSDHDLPFLVGTFSGSRRCQTFAASRILEPTTVNGSDS